ncbi:hypothetical protein KR222_004535, partial [Zaprionus bogoriensis]
MLKFRVNAFADPDEALPFNTSVVATIRTEDEEPIYSKLYPYPMGVADFVDSEVKNLLKDKIIQKSKSPYNNPIWVVDKKGVDEKGNKKKRMVIDFRKLNSKTIADKYPMPNISMILANLGPAKYFTTLDLKSGYHQITNHVADALSRQNVNSLVDNTPSSDVATIHNEASATYTIETTNKPINCFRNQIVIEETRYPLTRRVILFREKTRHTLHFVDRESLFREIKVAVNPKMVNAIHCDLHTLAQIQDELVRTFPATKFQHC